jgi:hypothetical protein
MSTTTTYRLPKTFWQDHVDRGCRCAETCPDRDRHENEGDGYAFAGRETRDAYFVPLTDADAAELLSDARHYSDATQWMGPDAIGLQSSARATVRGIEKARA